MSFKKLFGSILWIAMLSALFVPTAVAVVDCDAEGDGADSTECEQGFDLGTGDSGTSGETGAGGGGGGSGDGGEGGAGGGTGGAVGGSGDGG
ncbi:MAG TPA: hypothetical protein VHL54_11105, partial [Actinomycetota bacterium]|nr:hypothetical protein [Actinomycetota bacterium]